MTHFFKFKETFGKKILGALFFFVRWSKDFVLRLCQKIRSLFSIGAHIENSKFRIFRNARNAGTVRIFRNVRTFRNAPNARGPSSNHASARVIGSGPATVGLSSHGASEPVVSGSESALASAERLVARSGCGTGGTAHLGRGSSSQTPHTFASAGLRRRLGREKRYSRCLCGNRVQCE